MFEETKGGITFRVTDIEKAGIQCREMGIKIPHSMEERGIGCRHVWRIEAMRRDPCGARCHAGRDAAKLGGWIGCYRTQ